MRTDSTGSAATASAASRAWASNLSAGITSFTSPAAIAFSTPNGRPSSSSSAARWYPASMGRSMLDPPSGASPSGTKGIWKREWGAA